MPSFTAKHYQAVADVIHQERKAIREAAEKIPHPNEGLLLKQTNVITLAMSKLFEKDNPKFKQMQFIAACNRDLVE
jgi:hypothetical protein